MSAPLKIKRPKQNRPSVAFHTRSLYSELRDRMHVIADRKGATVEWVLNIALKKGLDEWEREMFGVESE